MFPGTMGPSRPPTTYQNYGASVSESSAANELLEQAFALPLTPHHLAVALLVQSCGVDRTIARTQLRRPRSADRDPATAVAFAKLAVAHHLIAHADSLLLLNTNTNAKTTQNMSSFANTANTEASAGSRARAGMTFLPIAAHMFHTLPPAFAVAVSRVICSELASLAAPSAAALPQLALAPPPTAERPPPRNTNSNSNAAVTTAPSGAPLALLVSSLVALTDATSSLSALGAQDAVTAAVALAAVPAATAAALAAGAVPPLAAHPFHLLRANALHARARSAASVAAFGASAAVAEAAAEDVAAATATPVLVPFAMPSVFSAYLRAVAARAARLSPA